MNVYEITNYKLLIRAGVKIKKKATPSFTLQKLSSLIPLQYTYLSKVLNDENSHLNEDHSFRIAQYLEFSEKETEYFLLLRSIATSSDTNRINYLKAKCEKFQKEQALVAKSMRAVENRLSGEMSYLFDPLCIVVHLALHIPEICEHPQQLCTQLQISQSRLKNILDILDLNNFIELHNQEHFKIKKVNWGHFHYGKDHPLMRTHQNIIKSTVPAKLQQVEEGDKHSFLATFTLDQPEYEQIKSEFNLFIKKVQGIVKKSPAKGVYQLNFDFFRWI